MATPETNANPNETENPQQLYDALAHQVVFARAYNVAQDVTSGRYYGDPGGSVNPPGEVRVAQEQTQVFYDPFDQGALDTVNNWKPPVATGGGVLAAVTAGLLNIGSGTTISGYSVLESSSSFRPPAPGWFLLSMAIKIEQPVTANAYRFWGVGTNPGSPTAALPLTDAVGFEMSTTGVLSAVIFAGGAHISIQDLSTATGNAKQPADGQFHAYGIYLRADKYYWVIDGLDKVVATTNFFQTPNIQTLPVKMLSIANTVAPSVSAVITCPGIVLSDTARNAYQLADGTYPWRKVKVDASGNLSMSVMMPDIVVVPSAAYTTTQTQSDQTNTSARGLRVVLDATVIGTGSVTLEIDAKDVASGKYIAQLTGAAVITSSTNTYVIYPGLTPVANSVVSDVLPRTWRIKVTANNANSATYSVGASYIV